MEKAIQRYWPVFVLPTLLALHQPPSATLLNQCLAVALWGSVVAVMAPGLRPVRGSGALLATICIKKLLTN